MPEATVIETERLLLRPPTREDTQAIFERYASDAEVTRYLGWPTHTSVQDTEAFVGFSLSEWARWGVGPLLAFDRESGTLLGRFWSRDGNRGPRCDRICLRAGRLGEGIRH